MDRSDAAAGVDLRRAGDRFATRLGWLESRHSFSFGPHWDPANTHHGLLLVNNDDVVAPGRGFGSHPHRDMEIVTWVLEGSLVHRDSEGNVGVITPGLAQRMSAGTGIVHAETNDDWLVLGGEPHDEPVHLVQMWVPPDVPALAPSYEQADVGESLAGGGLVVVASGMAAHEGRAAVRIQNRHAALHVARLAPGGTVDVPAVPFGHVFVARGLVEMDGVGILHAGDAVRLTSTGGQRAVAVEAAEVLVWEMHASVGR